MKRLVIDTDPGVDDAQAIMMASAHPDAKIEALTTVSGNVSLSLNTANACKILDVLEESAPIYAGCEYALVEQAPNASFVHGSDGLGDCDIPTSSRKVEDEHAVNALVRLGNQFPGELSLVALGPLTNIAMAVRLDPELPSKYKELIVMGGAIYAKGNTHITTSEFNVYKDPEAAAIVFENWPEFTLVSWETTMDHGLNVDKLKKLQESDSPRGQFFNKISVKTIAFIQEVLKREMLFAADPLAMAVALEPDIVTESEKRFIQVELIGKASRGQTIVDWNGTTEKNPNANIVLKVNEDRFFELLHAAVN